MTRSEFSKKTKHEAWERCNGFCEGCGTKLFPGRFEYDHDKECFMGGDNSLENCRVLCRSCHDGKTKERRPVIDKTRRMHLKFIGAWPKSRAKIRSRGFPPTRRVQD